MDTSGYEHACTHVCTNACMRMCIHTHTDFVNNSNITISIDATDVGEFQELYTGNPSQPIIAGNLLPHIRHTENMSNEFGNNPRLPHTERGWALGLTGFGLPGAAQNACMVSDSISRYCRQACVIGKVCPNRKSALFNKVTSEEV